MARPGGPGSSLRCRSPRCRTRSRPLDKTHPAARTREGIYRRAQARTNNQPGACLSPGPRLSQNPAHLAPPLRPAYGPAPPATSQQLPRPSPRGPALNRTAGSTRPALLLPHWRFLRPYIFARPPAAPPPYVPPPIWKSAAQSLPVSPPPCLPAPPASGPSHLAAATAEPVAAHGVVSQGAFLATVPARAAALLRDAGRRRVLTLLTQTLPRTHPRGPRTSLVPAPSRSRTPPPPPRSRSHTQAGPGAGPRKGVRSLARGLPKPCSHVSRPGTLRGLLKRQLPPPSCRNWLYSSMLQRENLRGR